MNETPIYVKPIKSIAKVSENLLTFEQMRYLPWWMRDTLSIVFWGYHILVLVLVLLEGPFGFSGIGLAKNAGFILTVIWMPYFANVILIYLPFNGVYSLYNYLQDNNIQPIHAFMISIFTAIGIVSVLLLITSQ